MPRIHFHDLRHTGNNLTAEAGASLRELMDRMGHSSTGTAPSAAAGDQLVDRRRLMYLLGLTCTVRAQLTKGP